MCPQTILGLDFFFKKRNFFLLFSGNRACGKRSEKFKYITSQVNGGHGSTHVGQLLDCLPRSGIETLVGKCTLFRLAYLHATDYLAMPYASADADMIWFTLCMAYGDPMTLVGCRMVAQLPPSPPTHTLRRGLALYESRKGTGLRHTTFPVCYRNYTSLHNDTGQGICTALQLSANCMYAPHQVYLYKYISPSVTHQQTWIAK